MLTTKRIIGITAAFVVSALAVSVASAGFAATSIDSLPKAESQNVFYSGGSFRSCPNHQLVLPRGVIYLRLMRKGYYRVKDLRYRPGRVRFIVVSLRRVGGTYRVIVAAWRDFDSSRRYKLSINACTGRVVYAEVLRNMPNGRPRAIQD